MNLAQQNLYMLKRLTEKKSEYSVKKMEEDYKKVQNYKKIMCNFPCINFKNKRGFSSDNKYNIIEKNEMAEYFPTINYLNDGYLKKFEKKAKNDKKKEENKIGKNLFKNKDENTHKINENKVKNDIKKLNEENEYENEFEDKIIDISRNESDNKDDKEIK